MVTMTNLQEDCIICEENNAFYNNVCCHCYKQSFDFFQTKKSDEYLIDNESTKEKILPYELYKKIIKNESSISNLFLLKDVIMLKRYLLHYIKQKISYDERIEIKCSCGSVLPVKSTNETICSQCEMKYCSRCRVTSHTGVSCEKLVAIKKKYFDNNTQLIMKKIFCNSEELKKYLDLMEREEETYNRLKKLDLRICPYTNFESAVQCDIYNYGTNDNRAPTHGHTKESWEKVACNADPVTKIHCDSMYCRQHNPERVSSLTKSGINVGVNTKGCGRYIMWRFWIKYKPVIEKKKIDLQISHTDANIFITEYPYQQPYVCDICEENRNCFSVKCFHSQCEFKNQQVCGYCITSKERPKFSSMVMTIQYDKDTQYVIKKNSKNGRFKCAFIEFKFNREDHSSVNVPLVWDEEYEQWKLQLGSGTIWGRIGGLNYNMDNFLDEKIEFRWCTYYTTSTRAPRHKSPIIFTVDDKTTRLVKLQKFSCMKNKHLLDFNTPELHSKFEQFIKWQKIQEKKIEN